MLRYQFGSASNVPVWAKKTSGVRAVGGTRWQAGPRGSAASLPFHWKLSSWIGRSASSGRTSSVAGRRPASSVYVRHTVLLPRSRHNSFWSVQWSAWNAQRGNGSALNARSAR
ncbi:MAG: Glycogen debranching enzyme (Alpha-1,6-glucosidase) [uncultured Phycisphaerae bacterium]|uniref:Glycogen debranching enzyme (Alpha-1,6-glucosidase) n=2 Tax=Pseudomonadati TaxID=3379134 RepID=A0A6J4LDP4_9BACT|nr:MAG: Glycogen debranching enzyme (Alpha-1,6-glucosidase) [uncultured Gemmatimonadaceae bacterium]CAA9377436.1 MAG: Glycogen debranching enzyme (Alpha-1,6-glucosidase) [uncultured Phycisphaerae bacterium]